MKVYIVTSGEYSDYSINAVFSTIELAEEYKNRHPRRDDMIIEDFELDEVTPQTGFPYEIGFHIDGGVDIHQSYHMKYALLNGVKLDTGTFWAPNQLLINLMSESPERAMKIARERYSQIMALNQQDFYKDRYINYYTKEEIE